MALHGILSESKSPKVSRNLISIRSDHKNFIVWLVSIRSPITNSSSNLIKPLKTVPRALIIISITIFSCSLAFSNSCLFLFSLIFSLWSAGTVLLFTPLEFFTSVLADGLSLEFEWQQVSSSLQDSSQYSGRHRQCCRLDSLHPSANFQVLQAL